MKYRPPEKCTLYLHSDTVLFLEYFTAEITSKANSRAFPHQSGYMMLTAPSLEAMFDKKTRGSVRMGGGGGQLFENVENVPFLLTKC